MTARLLAILALLSSTAVSAAEPPGIGSFAKFSRFVDARISPNGTYLAAISVEDGKRYLVVVDIKARKQVAFRPDPESVGRFYWATDSRVVVQLLNEGDGTLASPVNNGEIYAFNAGTGTGEMIYGYRANVEHAGGANISSVREYGWAQMLGRLRDDPRRVLIETGQFSDVDEKPLALSKMDVFSGRRQQITMTPMPNSEVLTDEMGEPRVAGATDAQLKDHFFYRDVGGPWTELNLRDNGGPATPINFESQTRTLDVMEKIEKGFGVFSMQLDGSQRKQLSQNDWVPPRAFLSDRNNKLLAVQYEPDLPVWDFVVPDHPLIRALKGMLAAFPDDDVRFVSATDDNKKLIAYVYSDRNPGKFLLVDVDTLKAEELVSTRPWVKPEDSAEMTAFHTRASDGVWIHGYVTLPKGAQPGKPPPLVVLPHGGPHGVRDGWGYDPEVQLLASRGFAVLQVNYRGSGGYGRKYLESGYRHWGDRIVQDIIDATNYAVNKGYGDGKRMCIYGGSFGAYAALQSSIVAPDLFRCAVGYAGIYDLTLMAKAGDIPERRLGRGYLKVVLGEDEASLKAQSPVYNAQKIKAKVLLIHGKQDKRAPIEHAEKLRDAMKAAGLPEPGWLVESREGHGFYDEGARERMYTQLVAFLKANTQ